MQMMWWFAYDYDFRKWGFQYYYRPEFGGHIQKFYFSVNFKLLRLNHRKHMGTQEVVHGMQNKAVTTHLLSIERADWSKLHDMF